MAWVATELERTCPRCARVTSTPPRAGQLRCGSCGASWPLPPRPAAPPPSDAEGTLGALLAALRARRAQMVDLQLGPTGGAVTLLAGPLSLTHAAETDADLFRGAIERLDRCLAALEGG